MHILHSDVILVSLFYQLLCILIYVTVVGTCFMSAIALVWYKITQHPNMKFTVPSRWQQLGWRPLMDLPIQWLER